MRVWNLQGQQLTEARFRGFDYKLEFSPNGNTIALSETTLLHLKTSETSDAKASDRIHVLRMSEDGKFLATLLNNGTVAIWNTQTNTKTTLPLSRKDFIDNLRFSPTGDNLLTHSGQTGMITIWNQQGTAIAKLPTVWGEDSLNPLTWNYPIRWAILGNSGSQKCSANLDNNGSESSGYRADFWQDSVRFL